MLNTLLLLLLSSLIYLQSFQSFQSALRPTFFSNPLSYINHQSITTSSAPTIPLMNPRSTINRSNRIMKQPQQRSYRKMRYRVISTLMNKRKLNLKEEIFAGKLCKIAKELEKKRSQLEKSLLHHEGREVTDQDWARSSNLTVSELRQTIKLSQLARDKLVAHNLGLVDHVVCRFLDRYNYPDERITSPLYLALFQQGSLGLKKAAEYYDGRYKFSFFAIHFIQQECHRYFSNSELLKGNSYVPHEVRMIGTRIQNQRQRLTKQLKRLPTEQELSKRLSLSPETMHAALSFIQKNSAVQSASNVFSQNGGDSEGAVLTYEDALVTSSSVEDQLYREVLREAIEVSSVLSEKEKTVMLNKMSGLQLSGVKESNARLAKATGVRVFYLDKVFDQATEKLVLSQPELEETMIRGLTAESVGFATKMKESVLFAS